MDAAAYALRYLGIEFQHRFATDPGDAPRVFLRANYQVQRLFATMQERPTRDFHNLGVYVAGPPVNLSLKQDRGGALMIHAVSLLANASISFRRLPLKSSYSKTFLASPATTKESY